MSFYGFKPNPRQLVYNKAKALFGREAKVDVRGTRLSPLESKLNNMPSKTYLVECDINDKHTASAHHANWRKAYNLLVIALEKAYEADLHRAEPV